MEQSKKKIVTAILCLLDSEGFEAFDEIPYLSIIRPVLRRDRDRGLSLKKLSIRYKISVSQVRTILKSMSKVSKEKQNKV